MEFKNHGASQRQIHLVNPSSVTILGGGISGLACAHLLAKNGVKVRVIEGSSQFGGLMNTFPIGGTRLEHFYHHFFTHDAEINWLLADLGLADKIAFRKTSMGVFRKGKAYDFNGPADLLKFSPIDWPGKIRFAATSLYLGRFAKWQDGEDIPALEWFYRYAGKSATDSLWRPLLEIKFGPYHDRVPIAWMIGRLSQRMQSRQAGEERLGYLEGSLYTLLERLLQRLQEAGVELISDAPVESLEITNGRLQAVQTPKGRFADGEFIATLPTTHLAPLLKQAGANSLASSLSEIDYFGAVCGILEMKKPLGRHYWLNVAEPGLPFGGIIEHTQFIDPEVYGGRHLAYLSRYFAKEEEIASMSEEAIRELFLGGVSKVYPHFRREDLTDFHLFRTRTAATVCDLQFSKRVPECRTEIGGLYLANMAHVYPDERSVNNSIRVACETLRVMGHDSSRVPKGRSLSGLLGFG
jgi:protoporphyrinogen oxidase